jgi:hypothetical protein
MEQEDYQVEMVADEFETLGMRQDGDISGKMIELRPGAEADSFYHYIIPHAMWKANIVGREVAEGEYRYWHWAPWQACMHSWESVRHNVASCVEEVEGITEKGEVEGQDGESGDSEP